MDLLVAVALIGGVVGFIVWRKKKREDVPKVPGTPNNPTQKEIDEAERNG